jgi:hypothetical protein
MSGHSFCQPARVWSAVRRSTVAWYYSSESACLIGHDYTVCPHTSQAPRYARVLLGNVQTLLFSRYSQILLYSSPPDSCGTRGGVGALLSVEAGSGAVGHVVAPKPSLSREAGPGRMAGPLGGDVKDPGAPTTRVEDVNGGPPWEAMSEIQECPPPMLKMLMVGPLRGDARDPRASTTYV